MSIYKVDKTLPSNLRKLFNEFKSKKKNIKKVCKGELKVYYDNIISALGSNRIKYIYVKQLKGKEPEIKGFMISRKGMLEITIDYLCSNERGVGTKFIRVAENLAIANELSMVKLVADKKAVGFYKKKGFKMIDKEMLMMAKEIKAKIQRQMPVKL